MTILQSFFLGVLQGFTEFLPVSSSGHLVLLQKIFGISEPPVAFDTILHFATMIAIIYFLRKEIKSFFPGIIEEIKQKKKGPNFNLFLAIFLGSLPIVIVGLLLLKKIEVIFNSLLLVGISFFLTAIILFTTSFVCYNKREIKSIKAKDAIFIGVFQALAILPGVSRSGSTISAAIFRNIKKQDAFNFSFLLGIVAIFGAIIIQIPKISKFTTPEILTSIIGFFAALFSGLLALKILKKILLKGKFYYFAFYCVLMGIFCIVFSLIK